MSEGEKSFIVQLELIQSLLLLTDKKLLRKSLTIRLTRKYYVIHVST